MSETAKFLAARLARANAASRHAVSEADRLLRRAEICDGEHDARVAAALNLTISNNTADDDCDSPDYTLLTWAIAAIDGRQYRRATGPDVRFAFAMGAGRILEVRPVYITTAADFVRQRACGISDPFAFSDSNFQHEGSYHLFVYPTAGAARPIARGVWDGGTSSDLISDGPQELTDEIAATLWRVHRDRRNAFVGMPFCGCCRRPLTDTVSGAIGIGPECARLLGIPHGRPLAREIQVPVNEKACPGNQPGQAAHQHPRDAQGIQS
jgi:hypothetical protein